MTPIIRLEKEGFRNEMSVRSVQTVDGRDECLWWKYALVEAAVVGCRGSGTGARGPGLTALASSHLVQPSDGVAGLRSPPECWSWHRMGMNACTQTGKGPAPDSERERQGSCPEHHPPQYDELIKYHAHFCNEGKYTLTIYAIYACYAWTYL